ncbi:MAG: hypothetical protein M3Y72_14285 [Acidobacteriota bacterium]|nr:hypothetical protein [Acidobacteriota bacterium]
MDRRSVVLPILVSTCLSCFSVAGQAASFTFQKGDIVAGTGDGTYKVFSSTGTFLTTLNDTSGSLYTAGGAFDANGNLFVTNFATSTVSEFDKNGKLVTASFGSGFNASPESVTINKAGDIFVGQADGTHHVLEFNLSGTLLNTFTPLHKTEVRIGSIWRPTAKLSITPRKGTRC